MGGDECSWAGCYAEPVAWINARAWCERHGLRVLEGDRPRVEDADVDEGRIPALRRIAGDAA